jgi:small subunit ribosomal protein S2
MGVAVVALIDTDSDPDTVDLPIPGNDDSIRSIEIILNRLADAVLSGRAALPADQANLAKPRPPVNVAGNGPNVAPANPKPASAVVE